MKQIASLLLISAVIAGLAGCGVKGRPQLPLKKGETKNESTKKQNP